VFGHSIKFVGSDEQVKQHSCLADPLESPVFVLNVKPANAEHVRTALEKDKIGFQTKYVPDLLSFFSSDASKGCHTTV
jgi:hypothetical protein